MVDALAAEKPLIRASILVGNLRLPDPLAQERLILQAQTGLCEADRLSTLARRGPGR
jgi:hypothetical protein